jgi:hypothetical protein
VRTLLHSAFSAAACGGFFEAHNDIQETAAPPEAAALNEEEIAVFFDC